MRRNMEGLLPWRVWVRGEASRRRGPPSVPLGSRIGITRVSRPSCSRVMPAHPSTLASRITRRENAAFVGRDARAAGRRDPVRRRRDRQRPARPRARRDRQERPAARDPPPRRAGRLDAVRGRRPRPDARPGRGRARAGGRVERGASAGPDRHLRADERARRLPALDAPAVPPRARSRGRRRPRRARSPAGSRTAGRPSRSSSRSRPLSAARSGRAARAPRARRRRPRRGDRALGRRPAAGPAARRGRRAGRSDVGAGRRGGGAAGPPTARGRGHARRPVRGRLRARVRRARRHARATRRRPARLDARAALRWLGGLPVRRRTPRWRDTARTRPALAAGRAGREREQDPRAGGREPPFPCAGRRARADDRPRRSRREPGRARGLQLGRRGRPPRDGACAGRRRLAPERPRARSSSASRSTCSSRATPMASRAGTRSRSGGHRVAARARRSRLSRWLAHAREESIVWRDSVDLAGDPRSRVQALLNMAAILGSGPAQPALRLPPDPGRVARRPGVQRRGRRGPRARTRRGRRRVPRARLRPGGLLGAQRDFVLRELGLAAARSIPAPSATRCATCASPTSSPAARWRAGRAPRAYGRCWRTPRSARSATPRTSACSSACWSAATSTRRPATSRGAGAASLSRRVLPPPARRLRAHGGVARRSCVSEPRGPLGV